MNRCCEGWTVYKVTNTVTGQVYIGKTSLPLPFRFGQHVYASVTGTRKTALVAAMQEFGWRVFVCEPCAEKLTQQDADVLEREFIQSTESFLPGKGYNRTFGGSKGCKYTPETLARMKEKAGHAHSEETKKKIGYASRHRSPKVLAHLSELARSQPRVGSRFIKKAAA